MSKKIIINNVETPMHAQIFGDTSSRILFFVNISEGSIILNADKAHLSSNYPDFNSEEFSKDFYDFLVEKGFNVSSIIRETKGVLAVFEVPSLNGTEVNLGSASSDVMFEKEEQLEVSKMAISSFNA